MCFPEVQTLDIKGCRSAFADCKPGGQKTLQSYLTFGNVNMFVCVYVRVLGDESMKQHTYVHYNCKHAVECWMRNDKGFWSAIVWFEPHYAISFIIQIYFKIVAALSLICMKYFWYIFGWFFRLAIQNVGLYLIFFYSYYLRRGTPYYPSNSIPFVFTFLNHYWIQPPIGFLGPIAIFFVIHLPNLIWSNFYILTVTIYVVVNCKLFFLNYFIKLKSVQLFGHRRSCYR